MTYAFADIQGFKDNSNEFILKEIAVITTNSSFHDVIKSPYSIEILDKGHKRDAEWLTGHYHGIKWDDGTTSMTKLRQIIKPMLRQKIIYVKGEEKVGWMRLILGDKRNRIQIINLECMGCCVKPHEFDALTDSYKNICKRHPKHYHCALRNVLKICKWYLLNM